MEAGRTGAAGGLADRSLSGAERGGAVSGGVCAHQPEALLPPDDEQRAGGGGGERDCGSGGDGGGAEDAGAVDAEAGREAGDMMAENPDRGRNLRGDSGDGKTLAQGLMFVFCLLFGLAMIADTQAAGDGVWYWYATFLHSGKHLYRDMHLALQPLYVLETAWVLALLGKGWVVSKAPAILHLVAYCVGLLLLVRRSELSDGEKAVVLGCGFLSRSVLRHTGSTTTMFWRIAFSCTAWWRCYGCKRRPARGGSFSVRGAWSAVRPDADDACERRRGAAGCGSHRYRLPSAVADGFSCHGSFFSVRQRGGRWR